MNRTYDSGNEYGIEYFFGNEVENTPFKGKRTLFVASPVIDTMEIARIADQTQVEHIYLGANHCFYKHLFDARVYSHDVAKHLSKWCVTIDLPIENYTKALHFIKLIEARNHPMDKIHITFAFKTPFIESIVKYVSFKLDDNDFNATNSGVWVFSVKDLPKETFNDWSVYAEDKIIK